MKEEMGILNLSVKTVNTFWKKTFIKHIVGFLQIMSPACAFFFLNYVNTVEQKKVQPERTITS